MRRGPRYLFCGSRLTSDTLLLRLMLEGLNTQARHWQETITILDSGTVEGLEFEVGQFKHLEHAPWDHWDDQARPNIVIAFMDRLSQNRGTERLLELAATQGVGAFVVSSFDGP